MFSESVLLDSGTIWAVPGYTVLKLTLDQDQIIWVSRRMSMSYDSYKSDKEERIDK